MSNDDELHRRLAELRAIYIAESPERLGELWRSFARVQNGDVAALVELGGMLHRLAGTGGSYGLMGVTEHARVAEHTVRALMTENRAPDPGERAMLRTQLQNLADAFAAASSPE